MYSQRNRRTAAPKPIRPGKAPAFPPEVAIPPHRGPVSTAIELPRPEPALEQLFTVPAKPKPPVKRRKPAAQRRKAQRTAKATGKPARRGPKIAPPAIPLGQAVEPLVAPLPKSRAPALYRQGTVLDQVAGWLKGRARTLWDRLGGIPTARPAPRRARLSKEAEELRRLRAENTRLKRQLAMLSSNKSQSPVGSPVPPP